MKYLNHFITVIDKRSCSFIRNKEFWRHLNAALVVSVLFLFLFAAGCGQKEGSEEQFADIPHSETESLSDETHGFLDREEFFDRGEEIFQKDSSITDGGESIIPVIKTSGFTPDELKEISQDGYLSYYYRRKYSTPEIKIVWDAVNTLFPQYTQEDKLLAARSTLAYHWVVYRTTSTHNMAANLKVTRQYKDLIEKFSRLHQIPVEMTEAVITWENSGGVSKTSWAECTGVGQLSWGAVKTAHEFYVPLVNRKKLLAKTYKELDEDFSFPLFTVLSLSRDKEAEIFDVAGRHKRIQKSLGIQDERTISQCNIEDAAIYLKLFYNNYGQRIDLAISAYHNGGLNNNDIIEDYLRRNKGIKTPGVMTQKEILEAIHKHDLSFIHLWKDKRSRNMLNGLKTVEGHITTHANSHMALGDESDIYNWKVAAAYGALYAPEDVFNGLVKKYQGLWDTTECKGLRIYSDYESIRNAIRSGWLVKIPSTLYEDKGVGGIPGGSSDYYKNRSTYNYYVTPEAAGLLYEINLAYRGRTSNPNIKVPLKNALGSKILENASSHSIPERFITHLQGVSFEIDLDNAPHKSILNRILQELFLHDHIYLSSNSGRTKITINPRYGKYYYNRYEELKF